MTKSLHYHSIYILSLLCASVSLTFGQKISLALVGGGLINLQTKHDPDIRYLPNISSLCEYGGLEIGYRPKAARSYTLLLRSSAVVFRQKMTPRSNPYFSDPNDRDLSNQILVDFEGIELGIGLRMNAVQLSKFSLDIGAFFNYIFVDPSVFSHGGAGRYFEDDPLGRGKITVNYKWGKTFASNRSLGVRFDFNLEYLVSKRFQFVVNIGMYMGLNHVVGTDLEYELQIPDFPVLIKGMNNTINNLNYFNSGVGLKYSL